MLRQPAYFAARSQKFLPSYLTDNYGGDWAQSRLEQAILRGLPLVQILALSLYPEPKRPRVVFWNPLHSCLAVEFITWFVLRWCIARQRQFQARH